MISYVNFESFMQQKMSKRIIFKFCVFCERTATKNSWRKNLKLGQRKNNSPVKICLFPMCSTISFLCIYAFVEASFLLPERRKGNAWKKNIKQRKNTTNLSLLNALVPFFVLSCVTVPRIETKKKKADKRKTQIQN